MVSRDRSSNRIYFSERILHEMGKITDYPLTLVEAPMGYGKSTAVKESLKSTGFNHIWIDINDDSIGTIWQEMCEGIRPFYEEVARELLLYGPPKDREDRLSLLNTIKQVKLDHKFVIVIDDFHLVKEESIYKFLELLALKEVYNLHIILIARFHEMESVSELSAKGYLNHVNKHSFELGPDDIKKSFKQCGIPLKDKEAERVYALTEGWHMGLCMLKENFSKSECGKLTRELYNLIENTLYKNSSTEEKVFLQTLSFLDDFTLSQASHITENLNSESLIHNYMKKNGFISYDEELKHYHLHPIYKRYLQDCFRGKDKSYQNDFYRKVADFHLNQNNYMEAMNYYYKVNDFNNLLYAVEMDRGHSIYINHIQQFKTYFDECPRGIIEEHPVAILIYAICLFSFNEMEKFQEVCGLFEEIIQNDTLHDAKTMTALKGEYEVLMAFTKYNDIYGMLAHFKKAAMLLEEPIKFLDTQSSWTFNSPSILFMFYREMGELRQEINSFKEAIPIYLSLARGHGSGSDFVMEAEYAYNLGDLDNAEILLNRALYPASRNGQEDIVICAKFLNARIAIAKGDYDLALALMKEMEEKVLKPKYLGLKDTVELCTGFLYAQLEQYEKVPTWVKNGDFEAHKIYFPAQPFYKMVYAKTLLINGCHLKLLGVSEEIMNEASIYPNCLSQVYILIYMAISNYQVHRINEGLTMVKKALEFAKADQLYMPFVENCDYLKPLLDEVIGEGHYQNEITKIFSLYKIYRHRIENIKKKYFAKDKPELTQREREIALLAADGLTNKEIGEQLFISANTVKMALKSIFSKLDINNRALLKQYFS